MPNLDILEEEQGPFDLDTNGTDIPGSARLAITITTTAIMGHDFAPMKNDLIIRAAKGGSSEGQEEAKKSRQMRGKQEKKERGN